MLMRPCGMRAWIGWILLCRDEYFGDTAMMLGS